MRRVFLVIAIAMAGHTMCAQSDSVALAEIEKFQAELNQEYANRSTSPLNPKQLKNFKGHPFFPINLAYRVKAKLVITPGEKFFAMQTSTNQPRLHRKYADMLFVLAGIP
ncbi:MAG: hypothetical protein ACKOE6_07820 [Flammeovirgaceae bacterium]